MNFEFPKNVYIQSFSRWGFGQEVLSEENGTKKEAKKKLYIKTKESINKSIGETSLTPP